MPVIPKAVAIAIFREGVQHGVQAACNELDMETDIEIEETGYTVGSTSRSASTSTSTTTSTLDWMRDKVGNYSEEFVVDALSTLCSDKEFECRIHE